MFMYQIIAQDSAFNNFKILNCSRKVSSHKILGQTTNTGSQHSCLSKSEAMHKTHPRHSLIYRWQRLVTPQRLSSIWCNHSLIHYHRLSINLISQHHVQTSRDIISTDFSNAAVRRSEHRNACDWKQTLLQWTCWPVKTHRRAHTSLHAARTAENSLGIKTAGKHGNW